MEYWKARGAKLTLLVNQINTQPARMTLVTLRAAQSKILKVWNSIDKRITKYHVEAADNAKFLGAIEKTSHSIYLEDPADLKGKHCSQEQVLNLLPKKTKPIFSLFDEY